MLFLKTSVELDSALDLKEGNKSLSVCKNVFERKGELHYTLEKRSREGDLLD